MSELPHTSPGVWTESRGDRFARLIRRGGSEAAKGCAIALLGLPDDTGTLLNNGRVGAALGPRAFRLALAAYGTPWDGAEGEALGVGVWDAGDAPPENAEEDPLGSLGAMHARATQTLRVIHAMGLITVCVGGSHDLTFPAIRALSEHAGGPVGGINVDAHLDVRDPNTEPGSGTPFRAAIEGGFLEAARFVEFGIGRFANSREHTEWVKAKGATIIGIDKALEFRAAVPSAFERISRGVTEPAFVSIDLDAIDGSQAPGVSAVNPMGLRVEDAVRIARRAGEDPRVRHFDIMELCPPHDDPAFDPAAPRVGRTARVAALLFLSFVAGVNERLGRQRKAGA